MAAPSSTLPNPNPDEEGEEPEAVLNSGPSEICHVSFNQDNTRFAVGTTTGFRILFADPIRDIFLQSFAPVSSIAMLFQCNVIALISTTSPRRITIWNCHVSERVTELVFPADVRAVRLCPDRIVAVLDRNIILHDLSGLREVGRIETGPNPKGLCAVSQKRGPMILACPGGRKGQVRVEDYRTKGITFINAHDSSLVCLELSRDGKMVVTASSKGTLIRIFGTRDGVLLQEVRRGVDRADIHSLSFSEDMRWLAASSDRGTVHVFSLKINVGRTANDKPPPAPDQNVPARSLSLSFIKGVLPKYFHSEWSFAQFRLHEGSTKYIVGFGPRKNTIAIVGMDGSFYRCEYDPVTGGEMKLLECHNFLNPGESFQQC